MIFFIRKVARVVDRSPDSSIKNAFFVPHFDILGVSLIGLDLGEGRDLKGRHADRRRIKGQRDVDVEASEFAFKRNETTFWTFEFHAQKHKLQIDNRTSNIQGESKLMSYIQGVSLYMLCRVLWVAYTSCLMNDVIQGYPESAYRVYHNCVSISNTGCIKIVFPFLIQGVSKLC